MYKKQNDNIIDQYNKLMLNSPKQEHNIIHRNDSHNLLNFIIGDRRHSNKNK